MKHFLLFYEVGDEFVERRAPFRQLHLEHARRAVTRGELVLGGALADPPDGAVLLFRGPSAAAAEEFARTDPYVTEGLVASWRVREWTTVVGGQAAQPVFDPSADARPIARAWSGRSSERHAAETYLGHVTGEVLDTLRGLGGFRGMTVFEREDDAETEFTVFTFWDDMDSVVAFAGGEPERAVVEPEARVVLSSYDETVRHYQIAFDSATR